MTVKLTGVLKTEENWKGSLDDYLQVGDYVDDGIYDHFINVLPPICMTSSLVQMREPMFHDVNGNATYATIAKIDGRWVYCGDCHYGKIVNVQCPYLF